MVAVLDRLVSVRRPALRATVRACGGWPAAFFADFCKRVRIAWIEYLRGFFRGACEKANGMTAYGKFLRGMTRATPRLAVEVREWAEVFRLTTDYGNHKRKSDCTRFGFAHDRSSRVLDGRRRTNVTQNLEVVVDFGADR